MRKKASTSSKSKNEVIKDENKYTEGSEVENKACIIDWEVRPGGLLVQKRVGVSVEENSVADPMIKIKVSYDSCYHDVIVPAESTFGNLKKILCERTGLHPNVQRLLFQGKEKDENECLHIAGVKDMSKVILMEDPASKELKKIQVNSVSCEAIARVRVEVDKLSHKVVAIEEAVKRGTRVEDREFVVLTELFMIQLLRLDSIEAEGEARTQRRKEVIRCTKATAMHGVRGYLVFLWLFPWLEPVTSDHMAATLPIAPRLPFKTKVLCDPGIDPWSLDRRAGFNQSTKVHRIQRFVDMLDNFKARNSKLASNCSIGTNTMVTTKWEKFDSGIGSLNAPNQLHQSTKITQEWEVFD
ncbi:putative LRR repeats and ubiquitin-like domain-containing protein-like [Capsicum annuum]|nr:putative LRR repeats and ubiquitin-like domain-containing protein-like [Capsicum annuum]